MKSKKIKRFKISMLSSLLAVVLLLVGFSLVAPKATRASAATFVDNLFSIDMRLNSENITSLYISEIPKKYVKDFAIQAPLICVEILISSEASGLATDIKLVFENEGSVSFPKYNYTQLAVYEKKATPFSQFDEFSKYGVYLVEVIAHYGSASAFDSVGIYQSKESLSFTHSPISSGDSNNLDICIGKYPQPTITATGTSLTVGNVATFGDNYTLNIGDYATNSIVKSVTNAWSMPTVDLNSMDTTALERGKAYSVWAVSEGKNLYKTSEKSEPQTLTVYDDIAMALSGSVISWGAVNNMQDYRVTVTVDGERTVKNVTGTAIDFSELNIVNGLCLVSVDVVNPTGIILSKSDNIVIKVSQLAAPVIRVEGENLVWDKVQGANGYRLFYNDTFTDIAENTVNLMELGLDLGNYNLKVRAIGNLQNVVSLSMRNVSTFLTQMVAINYNVNGDITSKLVEYGSTIVPPTIEHKDYIFKGWYYDKEFTKAVTDTDKVDKNLTLFAKLELNIVPLTFWQKAWKVLKPIVIWGGIILGAGLVVFIIVKIAKKKRG